MYSKKKIAVQGDQPPHFFKVYLEKRKIALTTVVSLHIPFQDTAPKLNF